MIPFDLLRGGGLVTLRPSPLLKMEVVVLLLPLKCFWLQQLLVPFLKSVVAMITLAFLRVRRDYKDWSFCLKGVAALF